MAQLSATRQELLRLRKKTKTAIKGKTLLKDKRDSLMRQFMATIEEAIKLRHKFDRDYLDAKKIFNYSNLLMDENYLESLSKTPSVELSIETQATTVMSVRLPKLQVHITGDPISHSLYNTDASFDVSLGRLYKLLPDLILLIEKEHSALELAKEIEKTRRRVNALDYVVIPELKASIREVQAKLEEQNRFTVVSLIKLKQTQKK